MTTDRVVILDTKQEVLAIGRGVFEGADVRIEQTAATTEAAVIEAAAGADAVIVDAGVPITPRVLDELGALRVVARAGIGYDNVDVPAARERGVTVTYVPDYCVEEVSTHAVALLLALARELRTYADATAAGRWDWEAGKPLHRLSERTLGIVAFGRLGRRTAEKARPHFGEILAYDPYVEDAAIEEAGVAPVGFEALLERADAVSIHTPLTEETRELFDEAAFGRMGTGTVLVNTSRGGVVDEPALLAALEDGTVRAAGLDVMAEEPPGESPLLDRPDVTVTPHVGWYSEESQREVARKAAEDVKRVLAGDEPRYPAAPDPY